MVKVEIVESNSPYGSEAASSRNSSSTSISSVSSDLEPEESVLDRLAALVDIVPPTTRHAISQRVSKTASWIKWGGKRAGGFVWVVTTSALLVALPLALVLEDEAKIVAQEREFLEQQQGQQQVSLGPPRHQPILTTPQMLAPSMYPSSNPNQPKTLVPPGF
jgi:import receptor subunit TOM22